MNVPFKNLFKRRENATGVASHTQKKTFIKTDKQIYTILGIVFAVSAVTLFCYWLLKERPYYNNLLAEKDELIKTLKFTRDKLKKFMKMQSLVMKKN